MEKIKTFLKHLIPWLGWAILVAEKLIELMGQAPGVPQ